MMEMDQVAAAFGNYVFTDQMELIRSIREHVANGGTVVHHADKSRMRLGWKDPNSDARWVFWRMFVRERKAGAFGDLIKNTPGRTRIADAFNHGHDWFDTTCCPQCRIYVVEDVMLS